MTRSFRESQQLVACQTGYETVSTFAGEVLAVDASSITIRGKEEEVKPVEKVIRNFPAGTALLNGEQEPLVRSSADYRLIDVKVGDTVYIKIHVYGDDHLCVSVRITRRPGGEVPKAPFEEQEVTSPYHEMMNAYQRFEEKGIPLPLKYDQKYQRALQEALAVKDNEALERYNRQKKMRQEGRIAPPPRPVSRK